MAFTGKATYDGGVTLPELAEDVSDVIGLVSPHETPLLDHLGDPRRAATSTVHEWLEDELLPNRDAIDQETFTPDAASATAITVLDGARFRVGDLVRPTGSDEVVLVTAVNANVLTVVRGYGGTTPEDLADEQGLLILGNAALEGAERGASRTTTRTRQRNFTQIFTAAVEVSGTQLSAQTIGVADELNYQMQERLRELLRDLENCVLNGIAPEANPEGSSTVRRSMNGIKTMLQSNLMQPGVDGIEGGGGVAGTTLTEALLNSAMQRVWANSAGSMDTIIVSGQEKRLINSFVGDSRGYLPSDTTFRDLVDVYESDFGVCRVLLSRWMPPGELLLLDSSRVSVVPMRGRSFHFKRLASSGDSEVGQVIGEYTLEMMNERAHGLLTGLTAA
jgi:hypothetical protein